MMEDEFIVILNYSVGDVLFVRLTDSDIADARRMEESGSDFSDFVEEVIYDRLGLRSSECSWMSKSSNTVVLVDGDEMNEIQLEEL